MSKSNVTTKNSDKGNYAIYSKSYIKLRISIGTQ